MYPDKSCIFNQDERTYVFWVYIWSFVGCVWEIWDPELWKVDQIYWSTSEHGSTSCFEVILGKNIPEEEVK